MKYGHFLEEGAGTIGFVAPSFGCNIEPYHSAFKNSLEKWKKLNYEVKCGPNVYKGSGVGISNTPKLCAKEFNEAYQDADSDVLISCGGGELMCEILDYIDFDALKKADAKWFMGYSDNTNLVFLLTTICDKAAIYGPCAPAFGMEPWHPSLSDAKAILTGQSHTSHGYDLWEKESLKTEERPLTPYHVTEPKILHYYNRGNQETPGMKKAQMSGRLIGGCLDSLINLCGTKYDKVDEFIHKYEEDGIVWYLEACDLNPMSIRRALWQLKHAGWFRDAKGFLIGRPYCFGEEMFGVDQYNAVTSMLGDLNVPIIMDLDIGHLPPMMPLVCGSVAHVSANGDQIEIEMDYR